MSKFKCKCMNITVHVKEKATREADGKAFVSQPVKSTFFSSDLFEVELAVGGITKVKIHMFLSEISACIYFRFVFFLFSFWYKLLIYNQTVAAGCEVWRAFSISLRSLRRNAYFLMNCFCCVWKEGFQFFFQFSKSWKKEKRSCFVPAIASDFSKFDPCIMVLLWKPYTFLFSWRS